MTGNAKRPRSIILRWAITYLLILLIPLTCFTYSALHMTEVVKHQVSDSNEVMISSLSEALDRKLNALNAAFSFIYTRRDLRDSCSAQNDGEFLTRHVRNLWEAINSYINSVGAPIDILIYYPEREYVITQKTANEYEIYYAMQRSFGTALSAGEWKALLAAPQNGVSYFLSRELRGESHENCIVLANSQRSYSRRANIFITIPLAEVQGLIAGQESRWLMLADEEGRALYLSDGAPALERLDLSRESGAYVTGADGARYVCDYRPSGVNNWYYAIYTAETSYWSTLNALRLVTALSILAALGLGILLSVIFLRRNYRPVQKLVRLTAAAPARANEFELIERSLRTLADEKNAMRATLDQQSAELQEYRALADTGASLREKYMPRLLDCLAAGDARGAQALTEQIFSAPAAPFPLFRICLLEQLYPLLHAYYAATGDSAARRVLLMHMEQVLAAQNADSLKAAFSRLTQYACASLREEPAGQGGGAGQEICQYVREHYREYDLNVSKVADAFGRHPQTVSRQFSAQMQMGLLEYINKLRLDYAIALMKEKRLSMEEIAQQSGFSDARAFRRAFNKAMGVNPSAYRGEE